MSNKLTRRDFLKFLNRFLAAIGLAGVLGPVVAYFYPPDLREEPPGSVPVAPLNELSVGDSRKVPFGRYPALVINTEEGLRAYSAVCTHFACIVYLNSETGIIDCPCHAGFYDPLDGSVISGPPPAPLKVLSTKVVDGIVYVKS